MTLKNWYFVICLLTLGIWACRQEKSLSHTAVPTYQSTEFLEFYKKFSTDSIFQLEHTVFPLEGMKAPLDSLDTPDPDFKWQMEEWVIQKEYDDVNGSFTREFFDMNGMVMEIISDLSGQFTMERRFAKLSSGWHLIYYRELGKY
jgi:hypothetical protein